MQSFRGRVFCLSVAIALGSSVSAAPDPAEGLGLPAHVAAAMRSIDAERIRAQVRFLSDDLLEGRGTGARGGDIAARYIATQFALDGLQPAGDNGALIIHRTDLASYGWDVVRSSWSGEDAYLSKDSDPKLKAAAWVQLDVARQLFSAAGLSVEDMMASAGTRDFLARELPVRFKAHIVSKVRKFVSYNVLAMLPGGDAGTATQAVVYSAHYDHLGIDPAMSGDNIYNGAVDNGTGVGVLLELAHAYGSSARPPHPVLFASVTAEEKGLLGSNYLGKHLPIPAARIALGLNFDAIPPIGVPESVNVTGAQRTSFYRTVEKTAKAFGFAIQPDAEPGAGHYYRSDHFSLARAGVPAFSINTGVKFAGHPSQWGRAQRDEYTAKHYHNPSDEYSPAMDFSSNAALAKFGFALGWEALLAKDTVSWLPGDEFEAARLHGGTP